MNILLAGQEPHARAQLERLCALRGHRCLDRPDHGVELALVEPGPAPRVEIVRELRRLDPAPRIAIATAYPSTAAAVSFTRAGVDDYVPLPASVAILEHLIRGTPASTAPVPGLPSLARVEREYIGYVLALHDGNVSQAARALGIHRQSLQRKLRTYPPRR